MANWCSNSLHTENTKIYKLFKRLEKKYLEENMGQTLKYFKDDRYLFDFYLEDGIIQFETKWSPAINTVISLAKKYKCNIELEFCETGNLVYGILYAYPDKHILIELDYTDFDKFFYIEDNNNYCFENKFYDSEYEILDILLERKKNYYIK